MNIIKSINLDAVIMRMVRVHGWSFAASVEIAEQYRRFLFLKKKYRKSLPPSTEIDEFWHNHILHTYDYHHHMSLIFGEYLHHYPYLYNATGYMSQMEIEDKFQQETQELYFQEFGEYIYEINPKYHNGGNINESFIK